MINGNVVIGIISLLICAYTFKTASGFPGGSSDGVPGAGYFPMLMSVIVVVFSIWLIIYGIKGKQKYLNLSAQNKSNIIATLCTMGATLLFLICWNYVHFIVSCSAYLILLGIIFKKKLIYFIPASILSASIIYYVFHNLLNIMLVG